MGKLEQQLRQKQTQTPQQIMQATVLQKTVADLEETILEELENNPVLEQEDSDENQEPETQANEEDEMDWNEEIDDYEPMYSAPKSAETRELPVPERPDFVAGLLKQIEMLGMDDSELTVAKDIIWNLDERGYLSGDPVLLADKFGITESKLENILGMIHQLEPKGLGARDLRECLMLQLDKESDTLAYKVIKNQFDNFANHRYEKIEKSLSCSEADLAIAIERISHLNPSPGEGQQITKDETVIPDVIVEKRDEEWRIITNDNWIPELRISNTYQSLAKQKDQNDETKRFIRKKMDSAEWFIEALHKRRETLIRVTAAILQRQPEFFRGNTNTLLPMKLQDIADDISMDVSTISRATRGKYVDTPYGVFELKSFFSESIELKSGEEISNKIIKFELQQLIESEDKTHPLTDEAITDYLTEKGFPVARRTVAKYRGQLKIPTARLRRQLTH